MRSRPARGIFRKIQQTTAKKALVILVRNYRFLFPVFGIQTEGPILMYGRQAHCLLVTFQTIYFLIIVNFELIENLNMYGHL